MERAGAVEHFGQVKTAKAFGFQLRATITDRVLMPRRRIVPGTRTETAA